MKLTPFLRLKKPEGTDGVFVDDLNENMDRLDAAIEELEQFQGDMSAGIVHMSQATTRTNIANGDSLATAFGKVMKWFADLKNSAFCEVVNNDLTETGGSVADARIVRTHGLEIDAIDTRVRNLETSFPDGCKVIADAITGEGVTTAETASPSTMAQNIAKIREGGNLAETKYAPAGKTWYAGKQMYTGTGQDKGAVTLEPSGAETVTSGPGYYERVTAKGDAAYAAGRTAALKGNATQADVLQGKTFSSEAAGVEKPGSIADYRSNVQTLSPAGGTGAQTLSLPEGVHRQAIVDRTAPYNAGYSAGQTAGRDSVELHKVLVGTMSSTQTGADEYDFTFTVPGVELTVDNFFLIIHEFGGSGSGGWIWSHTQPTVTYNASTGAVHVSGMSHYGGDGTNNALARVNSASLYCVYTKPRKAFIGTK